MYGALSYLWDFGFGGVERWGGAIKSPFRVTMQATCRGADNFNGERGRVHSVIMLHWNFIVNLTGYCTRFYRIHLLHIFLLFDLFRIYCWDWQGQKCKLKCPKIYEINFELYCNCTCCLNPVLLYKHH